MGPVGATGDLYLWPFIVDQLGVQFQYSILPNGVPYGLRVAACGCARVTPEVKMHEPKTGRLGQLPRRSTRYNASGNSLSSHEENLLSCRLDRWNARLRKSIDGCGGSRADHVVSRLRTSTFRCRSVANDIV